MESEQRSEFITQLREINTAAQTTLVNQIVERAINEPDEPVSDHADDRVEKWRREGSRAKQERAAEKERMAAEKQAIAECQRSSDDQHHRVAAVEEEVALLLQAIGDLFEFVEGLERRIVALSLASETVTATKKTMTTETVTAKSTVDIPNFLPRRRGKDGRRYSQPLVTQHHT